MEYSVLQLQTPVVPRALGIIHCPAPCDLKMYSLWLAGGHSERGCGCFLVDRIDLDETVRGHFRLQLTGWCFQLALKSKTEMVAFAGSII